MREDDEIVHIEDTLRSESFIFGIEHITDECQCEGKQCPKCELVLCIGNFHKSKSQKDGLAYSCRECTKAYRRSHYEANADQLRAYARNHYQANRDERLITQRLWAAKNQEANRKKWKQYKRDNAERVALSAKEYRQKNAEVIRIKASEWSKNNPDKRRKYRRENRERYNAHWHKREALKRSSVGSYTAQEWEALKARYSYTCLCCEKQEPEIKLTVDHVVPIIKHGNNTIDNIQPLCLSCNSSKGAKIIDYRLER